MKKAENLLALSILTLLALVFTSFLVSAATVDMLCLSEGQTVEFSKCNPEMPDKTCTSTTCQICVYKIGPDTFCPASINKCNDAGLSSCTIFGDTNETDDGGDDGDGGDGGN